MVGVYKSLTDFLPMLEEDKIGDWAIDRVNDGTPEHPIQMPFVNYSRLVREVEDAIYDFEQMHPEYGLNRYSSILETNGKTYGFSEHLQAVVYSLLSAQRPWAEVVKHLDEIDGIFFGYDAKKILEQTDTYFVDRIREIKCGNRNIHDQMKYLPDNIAILRSIETEYGSLDAFVISAPAHEIVKTLTDYKSKYKLRNMGEALCWEYLRNVGIDGAKPDVHLRRFLGSERMGKDNHMIATVSEVIDTVRRLSKESGLSMAAIDNIIWSFCSEQYGEICGASPKCKECPVKEHCYKK